MSEILVKNGFVYDPKNGVNGDVMDIAIRDNKIVDAVSPTAKVIDASGKAVMAGGIDIHAHVAGPKVNVGRLMRPEDKLFNTSRRGPSTRSGGGFSVPSVFETGYVYSRMGYTQVNEAAMPPLLARHTHEEMQDTPLIDQSAYTLLGNNWLVMEYIKRGEQDKLNAFVAWMLQATKGYCIKLVNPGGSEAWGWGMNCVNVTDPVPYFDVMPSEIITGLTKANEALNLPTSIHLHCNNLGHPGNYETTLDSIKLLEGQLPKNTARDQVINFAHMQFHAYGGTTWKDFESEASKIAESINKNKNMTVDVGFVTLDETTTMTADGPMEFYLHNTNHLKWANSDIELETAAGVVPYVYSPKIHVCGIQWAIGLELALMIDDPMQTFITTDHPNAGPFRRYPKIISWLMSNQARLDRLETLHKWVPDRVSLGGISRVFDFYDIAKMTRAGPARALGLGDTKGHLGVGADADVAIFDYNPKTMDPTTDPAGIERAFQNTAYTIKGGDIVVINGEVVSKGNKRTIWVDATNGTTDPAIMEDIDKKFLRFYSVTMNNYPVQDSYVHDSLVITPEVA
ncbi:MAG: formylmethanofuran dehydrogenase subunit A [Halobacteriota archaeon]